MFTGIIQEIGKVKGLIAKGGNLILEIESRKLAPKMAIGDSVSINGACQTVTVIDNAYFSVEAIGETLARTNIGQLQRGVYVNLELPLSPHDLLHGHLVQGHVDCTGRITKIATIDGSTAFWFEYADEYGKYLIEKGSIAVDGISLTVVEVTPGRFSVSVIPHTMQNTVFQYRKVGDTVNLEFDMIAKYVEKMVSHRNNKLTLEYLKEHGF